MQEAAIAPWWAGPVLSGALVLLGALIGSTIGFLAVQKAAKRQIEREERHARREVYARFLSEVGNTVAAFKDVEALDERAKLATEQYRQVLLTARDNEPLTDTVTALSNSASELVPAVARQAQTLAFRQYEVVLYGPPALQKASKRVCSCVLQSMGGGTKDDEGLGVGPVPEALAEFISLAHVDLGSYGRLDLREAERHIQAA